MTRLRLVACLALMTGCGTGLAPLDEPPRDDPSPGLVDPTRGCDPSPEVCGDGIDNDCNGVIDDLDADRDDHLATECGPTTTSPLPADDCADLDAAVHPGADEVLDGKDNDCDGFVDEATAAYDDDGDCFCEEAPCQGSTNASCSELQGGDCADHDAGVHPDASDVPDLAYLDTNCDGLDGDRTTAIYLDPARGNDAFEGTDPAEPVRTLERAMDRAEALGRDWVLVADGVLDILGETDFREGIHVAGRYDPADDWARDPSTPTTIEALHGVWIEGWRAPTEWQQIDITGVEPFRQTSHALWADDVTGLRLVDCRLTATDGRDGADGAGTSGIAGPGQPGLEGEDSCNECDCGQTAPLPGAGAAGSAGTSRGGTGGAPGLSHSNGLTGVDGDGAGGGVGGSGGTGGVPTGTPGFPGALGQPGDHGDDGAGGRSVGTFDVGYGYRPSDGETGTDGTLGAGGGGGGGGGGATSFAQFCNDWYGGAGGGGGAGGRPGRAGDGGMGGGASVALVLTGGADVTLENSTLITGDGGLGGDGGSGQLGGLGGLGGNGGGTFASAGGAGGRGGHGGRGGDGGQGGGGGGGPVFGVVCRDGASVTQDSTSVVLGQAGSGGAPNGAVGRSTVEDGC